MARNPSPRVAVAGVLTLLAVCWLDNDVFRFMRGNFILAGYAREQRKRLGKMDATSLSKVAGVDLGNFFHLHLPRGLSMDAKNVLTFKLMMTRHYHPRRLYAADELSCIDIRHNH